MQRRLVVHVLSVHVSLLLLQQLYRVAHVDVLDGVEQQLVPWERRQLAAPEHINIITDSNGETAAVHRPHKLQGQGLQHRPQQPAALPSQEGTRHRPRVPPQQVLHL